MTLANAVIWQVTVGPLYLTIGVVSGQITSPLQGFVPKSFIYYMLNLPLIYFTMLAFTLLSFHSYYFSANWATKSKDRGSSDNQPYYL